MTNYMTADTHFGHEKIIHHCNRPFGSTREMDEALIEAINETVGEHDTLYHLGDFCFQKTPLEYRLKIRCANIVLIRGNHDRWAFKFDSLFESVREILYLKRRENSLKIVMCHYPFLHWNRHYYHAHGHSHGTAHRKSWRTDVGVDNPDLNPLRKVPFGPVAVTDLMDLWRSQRPPIDHAGQLPGPPGRSSA